MFMAASATFDWPMPLNRWRTWQINSSDTLPSCFCSSATNCCTVTVLSNDRVSAFFQNAPVCFFDLLEVTMLGKKLFSSSSSARLIAVCKLGLLTSPPMGEVHGATTSVLRQAEQVGANQVAQLLLDSDSRRVNMFSQQVFSEGHGEAYLGQEV